MPRDASDAAAADHLFCLLRRRRDIILLFVDLLRDAAL